jgi:hypothetical protein
MRSTAQKRARRCASSNDLSKKLTGKASLRAILAKSACTKSETLRAQVLGVFPVCDDMSSSREESAVVPSYNSDGLLESSPADGVWSIMRSFSGRRRRG